jgi:hypothetical protein
MALDGCVQKNTCGIIKTLIDDAVMAPFVKMTLSNGEGNTITVGNNSNPREDGGPSKNHTVIRSFKYGFTTAGGGGGFRMEIEVTDEAGGSLSTFVNRMVNSKNPDKWKKGSQVNVQWGWIGGRCDSGDDFFPSTSHTAFLHRVNSTFANGLMKFNLEATDITPIAFQAVTDGHQGQDDQPVPLKEAIRKLCSKYNVSVRFLRPFTLEEWNFGGPALNGGQGDPDYPKDVWRENSQNFVQTIMNWIANAGVTTDKGRGISPAFNSQRPLGSNEELVLWEDEGTTNRKEYVEGCSRSLGTYIVNGGKQSSVLSFNPQIEFFFWAANQSSGGSSTTANQQLSEQDKNDPTASGAIKMGAPTFNVNTDNANRIHGTSLAYSETVKAQKEHALANMSVQPIKAELRVQGDPSLATPILMRGSFVSLVVLNPFHIQSENSGCGDWLQIDPCHAVLTNKNWMITGAFHEVKEGSYTTTIQLSLDAPCSNIACGMPLGASPDGFRIDD